MMGGDITVDSKPGMGSVFTLSLDLPGAQPDMLEALNAPADLRPPASPGAQDAGEGLDLIVADDPPVNRKFLRILLRRMGHRVRLASYGAEAVALAIASGVGPRRPLLRWWFRWRHLKAPLAAADLIAAGQRPGPDLGERLRALRAERLDQECL